MSNQSLAGKTVLITGGARRVGAAIARELHAAGANVAIHYRKSANDAEALAAELNTSRPRSAATVQADLLDIAKLPGLVEFTVRSFGALDVLVNNASTFHATPVGEITPAAWDDLLGTNLKAPLFLSQAAVPALRKSGGLIINIVDIHALRPLRHYTVYCTAKAGLHMLTRSLAKELGPEIRVNGIAPGPGVVARRRERYQHAREDHRTHHPQAHGDPRRHRAHRAVLRRARPFHHRPDPGGGRRPQRRLVDAVSAISGTSIATGVMTCAVAIERFPQLPDGSLLGRMHDLGRDLRQRSEHVRTLEQVRSRQGVFRGLLDAIAEQQHVEIHGARRPLGRITRPAALRFDAAQARDHRLQRLRRGETRPRD